jgi:hypothetical protein
MKKLTQNIFGGIFVASVLALVALFSPITPSVSAQGDATCPTDQAAKDQYTAINGIQCAKGNGTPSQLFGAGSIFTTIVNVLLFIIGAISVIMLIIGGIRYTISNGDSGAVTSAKNTILYAIVGLIIAFLAFAIVNWVLGAVTPGASGGSATL